MLSSFLIPPPKASIPSSSPCFLEGSPPNTHRPTPASPFWHSPTLGHGAFTGSRASPPIDVQQCHPLLHVHLEPLVPPCVFFGWWFSSWELWDVCLVDIVVLPTGVANTFIFFSSQVTHFLNQDCIYESLEKSPPTTDKVFKCPRLGNISI